MNGSLHVSLPLQCRDDSTRRALVQAQFGSQGVQCARPASQQRVQCVALGERDIVATDVVAFGDEVGPHEVDERFVEGLGMALKLAGIPSHCGCH